MINPFDLRGPQFLLFYLVFGGLTLIAITWLRRARESDGTEATRPLHDYLQIAYLRGGAAEAIRVATLTLIDRGLLSIAGDKVVATKNDAGRRVERATERALLAKCRTPSSAASLSSDSTLHAAARRECEPPLVQLRLLPDEEQQTARTRYFLTAALLLALVSATKILIAFSRGRTNIIFLIIETVILLIVAYTATHPARTAAGSALMQDLRTLFAGLKSRAGSLRPQSGGDDLALLAAVFGVSVALPVYPSARTLFPRATDSGGSGGCGSSCGSSCGGGGCGGGCGGCGG